MRKNFLLCTLVAVFASMQISYADGLANASINSTQGGFAGMENGTNSATLNFNGNTHVNWNTLNVNSNETLNFNAVNGASGLTILNTVSGGQMSQIYGTINSNEGISHLIISNPSGLLFNGAHFTTAGDLDLTTKPLAPIMDGRTMVGYQELGEVSNRNIYINDSSFKIGGTYNVEANGIWLTESELQSGGGIRLVTTDGVNYVGSRLTPATSRQLQLSTNTVGGVKLKAVSINGDIHIIADNGDVQFTDGGVIEGDLTINAKGNVELNKLNNGHNLDIIGDVSVVSTGENHPNTTNNMYIGNVKTDNGDISMENSGGDLTFENVKTNGNVNLETSGGNLTFVNGRVNGDVSLKTTAGSDPDIKSNIIVEGWYNNINGNMNIESENHIMFGNIVHTPQYDYYTGEQLSEWSYPDSSTRLQLTGDLNAQAHEGHVVLADSRIYANKISLTSDEFNILSGDSYLNANEYQFMANGYIGGVRGEHMMYGWTYDLIPDLGGMTINLNEMFDTPDVIMDILQNDRLISGDIESNHRMFLNIEGGDITRIETPVSASVYIQTSGDMTVDNVITGNLNLRKAQYVDPDFCNPCFGNTYKKVTLGENITADNVYISRYFSELELPGWNEDVMSSRDYTLHFDSWCIWYDDDTVVAPDQRLGQEEIAQYNNLVPPDYQSYQCFGTTLSLSEENPLPARDTQNTTQQPTRAELTINNRLENDLRQTDKKVSKDVKDSIKIVKRVKSK